MQALTVGAVSGPIPGTDNNRGLSPHGLPVAACDFGGSIDPGIGGVVVLQQLGCLPSEGAQTQMSGPELPPSPSPPADGHGAPLDFGPGAGVCRPPPRHR